MEKTGKVIQKMIEYYKGDIKRINHFIKVYGYAKSIGECENIDENTQEILEVASIVHDIGIKISEEKYGSSAGKYQEQEGPDIAEKMLGQLGYGSEFVERVCWLIAHHHTYTDIKGQDYQILVEADFLVNIFEDEIDLSKIETIKEKIFRTKSGIEFLKNIYK